MEDRKFRSDSILDTPPLVSDSAPVNALVPSSGGEITAPSNNEDVIEGEFKVEQSWHNQPSGFYCKKCRSSLLVGDHDCKNCGFHLELTTPPLEYVKRLNVDRQWTFYSDRIDGDELARIEERRKKRH